MALYIRSRQTYLTCIQAIHLPRSMAALNYGFTLSKLLVGEFF
uniref:Uncharacterized protein n=1 Tax=Setaria italica TaxID=4555 RepID=K3Y476_SETIT